MTPTVRLAVTLMTVGAAACVGSIDGSVGPGSGSGDTSPSDPSRPPRGPAAGTSGTGPMAGPVGAGGAVGSGIPGVFEPPGRELTAVSVLRRLTAAEYDATLGDLIEETRGSSNLLLPEDPLSPFDNDYNHQIASKALIEGLDLLAKDAADRLVADTARRDRIIGCKPAGATDDACLRSFVTQIGRRALRRSLAAAEVDQFVALGKTAQMGGDFYAGVADVVRALLQDTEFIYRTEIGTPVAGIPGLHKLGPFELGARLAYFLWGTMPDDGLLDRAQEGKLGSAADVRAAATAMLGSPRARSRIARFHALWLGYEELPHGADLNAAMRAETAALIERVVFEEKRPWQDLFRATETYVDDLLAKHYGLALPGGAAPKWVPYAATGRKGLLSHGAVLSAGAKFGDTSPTERGLFVRTRLFCEEKPEIPADLMVNVDEPPPGDGSPCKWDRYAAHRNQGACAGCHAQIDPIGFGLENYDPAGKFRIYDKDPDTGKDLMQCRIGGEGELLGVGTFKGPGELSDLVLKSERFTSCAFEQLYRFAVGRAELDETDRRVVEILAARGQGGRDFMFDELLLDYVSSPAFAHRREER